MRIMNVKKFAFPSFDEWVKKKHIQIEIGDYCVLISLLKTHVIDDFHAETFIAALYRSTAKNPVTESMKETTFVYIPEQFSVVEFEQLYKDACDFLNEAFESFILKTYID